MKIDDNSLFFTCSLLELIGRTTLQKRSAVTELLGKKVIAHIYANADVLHCEPIAKTADYYIDFCHIPAGDFDNVAACKYAVPSYWDIGKVYARLIEDVAGSDAVDTLLMVYHSAVSDMISNYNSDFFYQSREYIKEYFISCGDLSEIKQRKPAIRFSGFTDAWEQRKLGEMAVFSKGYGYSKNDLQESGTPIILYGRLYTKYKTIIDEVDTFVADRKGSIYSKGGEVIVPASGETAEDIAIASVVEHKDVILGGDLNVISPLAGLCSPFLALTISHGKPHCDLAKKAQGKSVVHLHNTDLQEIDIFYPSTREQTQIGIFFRSLDDLIALHQRKYDKLSKIKKSMLEKLFPKNGSNVPEIRFAGFTDAWEQRKLGEMAVFSKGYGYSKNDLQESGTPIILYGRLYTKYKTIIDEVDTFVADRKGSIYSKGGEVIVPASGETAEDIAIASVVEHKDVILGGDLNVISPLAGLCSPFLALTISHGKPHCDLAKKAQGKSVVHLHNTDLQEIDIFYPSTREQTQIGIFFRSLDDLIALHQRKLEKLKKIKQSCLEKMFV